MSFQTAMFQSGKCRYYLTIVDQIYWNCSGVCNVHYYLYKGLWRKKWITNSTSFPQLHIGLIESWKLCLNLCSRKCLRPSWVLVIYLIPIGLWQLWKELNEDRTNFRISFLKTLKLSHFCRLSSNLFHYVTVNGKKKILKKLCLVLKQGTLKWL